MSSRLAIKVGGAAIVVATLAGCSNDQILDRRDAISLSAGEANAANRVTQVIDPWPPASANRNIAYNGSRMQAAAERYGSHSVIQPINPVTSSTSQPQPPPALTTEAVKSAAQSTSATPAASVK